LELNMTDISGQEQPTSFKPLFGGAPEPEAGPGSGPEPAGDVAAATRLREFEDKQFGRKEPRIAGEVQRGYGSKHRDMPQDAKTHHAALERAVVAEKTLADARAKLAEAEAGMEVAEARVKSTLEAHEKAETERDEEAKRDAAEAKEKAGA
jgi:hypothetical protein